MNQELKEILNQLGYTFLLPIQEKAIPQILNQKNLFIQAQTGSGKTLAYLIPILEMCDANSTTTEALIITPTRELALQVSEVANKIAAHTKHHVVTVIGGLDIHKQENALKHKPTIIIGTPGRLKDLFDQNKIELNHLKMIVIDEVDMILSTGQRKETEFLIKDHHAQIICTSATKNDLICSFLPENYSEIIQDESHLNDKLDSFYLKTEDRKHSLLKLLHALPIQQAIVFTNYKNDANELAEWLQKKNILTSSFSSFFEEKDRIQILRSFKEGKIRVLVATDAAARGLDLYDVSHIIHYDIPLDCDTFIHRSGRSGHQGNEGTTITLIREKDVDNEVTKYILNHSSIYHPSFTNNTDLSIPITKKKEKKTTTTLQIQAGRKDKIRPKDIIGSLCQIFDFSEIGTLEIQDSYSTVIILKTDDSRINSLTSISIKGKKKKIKIIE